MFLRMDAIRVLISGTCVCLCMVKSQKINAITQLSAAAQIVIRRSDQETKSSKTLKRKQSNTLVRERSRAKLWQTLVKTSDREWQQYDKKGVYIMKFN